jgi:hypothetical protein
VEDVLRDLGLLWARSFPAAIAAVLGTWVVLAWAGSKAKDLEPPFRELALSVLVGVALGALVQWPAAVKQARADCRREWTQDGGGSGPLGGAPIAYRYSKCAKVWPNGPDAGSSMLP